MRLSRPAVVAAALLVLSFAPCAPPAYAHETASAGALALEVGWGTEPAYAGQLNTVQVLISRDGDPVNDPGARLTAVVQYGEQKQEFPLAPTYDAGSGAGIRGEYAALVIPTAPGDYTFRISGRVEGVKVALEVTAGPKTFSPVEDASLVQFPVKVPATEQVAQRLDNELPRLAVAQDVSGEVSGARTLGYVGIVAGAAGILLAGAALVVRRRP